MHHGNELDIDVRSVTWKRVVDLNDRALRDLVVGLGGVGNGYPREDGFDIVVASELMAIFCLTESWADLKRRIGDIVDRLHPRARQPVTARDLEAHGAMTVLLRDALAPNLVQTLEHAPAFVHGGPFANIAHGCSLGGRDPRRRCGSPTTSSPRPASAPTWAPRSSSTSSAASPGCVPTSRSSSRPCAP